LLAFAATQISLNAQSKTLNDPKMDWWKEARFGMFIHWGLYAVPAGTYDGKQIPGIGEWIMNKGKIPVSVYQTYPARFNPVKFNADTWVKLARDAGMKYLVITSKHHDGFAMFKSTDPFNIVDATPFKGTLSKSWLKPVKNTKSFWLILLPSTGLEPSWWCRQWWALGLCTKWQHGQVY